MTTKPITIRRLLPSMDYVVPKADQRIFEGHTFFKLTLPAEAKLSFLGSEPVQTKLAGLRLTANSIGDCPVKVLRAIAQHLLKLDASKMEKKAIVNYILEHIKLEA